MSDLDLLHALAVERCKLGAETGDVASNYVAMVSHPQVVVG